ncbi:MAG TPA: prepilin-type N-terminal cleavage/methylation domain-containing protein [Burkholderiales bacterium]|nr:prepilin-type N-terminal cleavage/methylation domain-containing protein [Burkholderiales bacterium]
MSRFSSETPQRGFTLVEALVVMVITGIIAAVVAVFIRDPVRSYFDASRRARLTDVADTALRRLTRDLRLALPNSVRVTTVGSTLFLEFLSTTGGGKYRTELTSAGGGDVLEFDSAANPFRFEVIGQMPSKGIAVGNGIVVYNLGPGFGTSDAYLGSAGNLRTVSAVSGNTITLSPATVFPQPSRGARFQVVEGPVTYQCSPNVADPASGGLRRYWGYTISAAQPTSFTSGSNALLASGVSACAFSYAPNAINQRTGLVSLTLTLTDASQGSVESVTLLQEAHVSNVP